MDYPHTELVLNAKGEVYHLGLSPDAISDTVILVGDQARVDLVASYFTSIEHSSQYREFACKTGIYNNQRISVLSTGIGTDNIDITINELDALYNIDLINRCDKPNRKSAKFVRIGTCGILQPSVPVHSYILTSHSMGLDNVAHYYEVPFSEEEVLLNSKINEQVSVPKGVTTYLSKGSTDLFNTLNSEKTVSGITVSSSGFYGPQGRQLRLKNRTQQLNEELTNFEWNNLRITNFEMESSALFALGKSLGHECATICLGIANRPNKDFSKGYKDEMLKLIKYVLDALTNN